ncbi:MAG: PDZ domain-containing protein [Magnetovibrionaceae bacterium]
MAGADNSLLKRRGINVFRPLLLLVGCLLTFALPLKAGAALASDVPFVGLQVKGLDEATAKALKLPMGGGAMVSDIAPDSPGILAGFRRGDVFFTINGTKIDSYDLLIKTVTSSKPGDELSVTVLRAGEEVPLNLTLIPKPGPWQAQKRAIATLPAMGLTLAAITPKIRKGFNLRWSTRGVLITLVNTAVTMGKTNRVLNRGDVIVQVNQQDVWKPQQVVDAYQAAKKAGQPSLIVLLEQPTGFQLVAVPIL